MKSVFLFDRSRAYPSVAWPLCRRPIAVLIYAQKALLSRLLVGSICVLGVMVASIAQAQLSLEQAVSVAQQNDPWLTGSVYRERATLAQSVAVAQLPDPMVSLGFANLPVDSFEFDQEPMTQLKIGLSQVFPRGNTRSLQRRQLIEEGAQQPYMRQDRNAVIALNVSQLWLDSYRNREAIGLIEADRVLFEQLVDVVQSSYSSAVGRARQQDLIRAQLELTRLDDRLIMLQQQQAMSLAKLAEWLPASATVDLVVEEHWPKILLAAPEGSNVLHASPEQLLPVFLAHPMLKALDQKIIATGTHVQLAQQKYKPQWGLNASYGYREDAPGGLDRSDFFSLGVSFDVPLFTAKRQDKDVQAAVATKAALKTDKALALRSMLARFETARARLLRLNQRKDLYQNRLLHEIHNQAEASLTAYTSDDGDFSEVVRARIAELNAKIDFLNIAIDQLKTIAELNYFFSSVETRSEGLAHE